MRTATAVATRVGTPTLLPFNAVVATPTDEPFIIVSTETPANRETALAYSAYATAVAVTTGTFTPIPPSAIRATLTRGPTGTPAPTATMLVQYVDQITPQAPPTPVPAAPQSIPLELKGKILFMSDRDGQARLFSLDPGSKRLAYVAENWPYEMAKSREGLARDGARAVVVAEDANRVPQVYVSDSQGGGQFPLTSGPASSYDAVWSPVSDRIAFVSEESGNPEIYTVNADGSDLRRLTVNETAADRHPSWSPNGQEILFMSGRIDGRPKLWIMNADGSNQRLFLESPHSDWDPVWEK
jgi:dipeptidyl aminopeptidase/acylaminoacyl peptidase